MREAALSQRDAYYRHWFIRLADELDDVTEKQNARFNRFPFGNLFGNMGDQDDDDDEVDFDDEDDLDFNPDCYCPDCQAARLAYANRQQNNKETPF